NPAAAARLNMRSVDLRFHSSAVILVTVSRGSSFQHETPTAAPRNREYLAGLRLERFRHYPHAHHCRRLSRCFTRSIQLVASDVLRCPAVLRCVQTFMPFCCTSQQK